MLSACTNRTINLFANILGHTRFGTTVPFILFLVSYVCMFSCMYVLITAMNVAMLNLIFRHSYLSHACEEFARKRHTCCEEFVRILHTCDKYEIGKMRFNSAF